MLGKQSVTEKERGTNTHQKAITRKNCIELQLYKWIVKMMLHLLAQNVNMFIVSKSNLITFLSFAINWNVNINKTHAFDVVLLWPFHHNSSGIKNHWKLFERLWTKCTRSLSHFYLLDCCVALQIGSIARLIRYFF